MDTCRVFHKNTGKESGTVSLNKGHVPRGLVKCSEGLLNTFSHTHMATRAEHDPATSLRHPLPLQSIPRTLDPRFPPQLAAFLFLTKKKTLAVSSRVFVTSLQKYKYKNIHTRDTKSCTERKGTLQFSASSRRTVWRSGIRCCRLFASEYGKGLVD